MDDITLAKKYVNKHNSSRDRGLEFSLSLSEYKRLINRKICAYTGLRFKGGSENKWYNLTLERIDNTKGYISGNVIPVCSGINQFKSVIEAGNNPIDIPMVERMFAVIRKNTN